MNTALIILIYTTVVVLVVVTVFLVRLLIGLTKLSENLNLTADIINVELMPILEKVGRLVDVAKEMVEATEKRYKNAKDSIVNALGSFGSGVVRAKGMLGGLLGGLLAGLRLFSKK